MAFFANAKAATSAGRTCSRLMMPRRAGGVWGWLQRCDDRGANGMGIRRNLYRLRGAAVVQKVEVEVEVEEPEPRRLFVIGWSGMSGVLSVAAAVSLPYALPDGRMFPQRREHDHLSGL